MSSPQKRQKKLAKHAAKRKKKHNAALRLASGGLPAQIALASKAPLYDCWRSASIFEMGKGEVAISRQIPGTQLVAYAVFLVDAYCLGVKDIILRVSHRNVYQTKLVDKIDKEQGIVPMIPAAARKYVEGAVAYARDLGFEPAPEYNVASQLFADADPTACTDTFEYGKDGKPLFTDGPLDTPATIRRALATLNAKLGPDGFHYLIMSPPDAENDRLVNMFRSVQDSDLARQLVDSIDNDEDTDDEDEDEEEEPTGEKS